MLKEDSLDATFENIFREVDESTRRNIIVQPTTIFFYISHNITLEGSTTRG